MIVDKLFTTFLCQIVTTKFAIAELGSIPLVFPIYLDLLDDGDKLISATSKEYQLSNTTKAVDVATYLFSRPKQVLNLPRKTSIDKFTSSKTRVIQQLNGINLNVSFLFKKDSLTVSLLDAYLTYASSTLGSVVFHYFSPELTLNNMLLASASFDTTQQNAVLNASFISSSVLNNNTTTVSTSSNINPIDNLTNGS